MFESLSTVLMASTAGGDPISNILAASAIAAGIAVFTAFGPSLGQGIAAGKAAEAVGRQPEASGQVRSTLLIGSVVAETGGVYGLLIALILLFANPLVDMYINAIQSLG